MADELDDAESYEDEAALVLLEYPDLAKRYLDLASQELSHAMYLHEAAVSIIDAKTKAGVTVPQGMMDVWNNRHQKFIKRYNRLKYSLSQMTGK
jgi:hypothetical protein